MRRHVTLVTISKPGNRRTGPSNYEFAEALRFIADIIEVAEDDNRELAFEFTIKDSVIGNVQTINYATTAYVAEKAQALSRIHELESEPMLSPEEPKELAQLKGEWDVI